MTRSTTRPSDDRRQPSRRRPATVAAAGVLALLLSLLPACAGEVDTLPRPGSTVDPAGLQQLLTTSWQATGLPGMAVAVTRGQQVVYLAGFGSDGHGRSVDADTQFMIASLSKSFTAVAVLQLVERGDVALDAPVSRYLPEFATADPAMSARITVRHLLNQVSGMADAGFRDGLTADPATLAERLRDLHAATLVSPPGQDFHYFDPNYQVLARLVEVVSGRSFANQLDREVFAPLDMSSTLAVDDADAARRSAPRLATGHVVVFGAPVPRPELDGLLAGSGGVVSTARDLSRWLIFHGSVGGPGTPTVLGSQYVTLTHTPPDGSATGYAQGWQVVTPPSGPRRIEHNGVLSTYSADQVLLPDSGYGFALLYDANAALVDTAGVKAALAAYLDGTAAPTVARGWWWEVLVLGALSLAVVAAGAVSVVRVRRRSSRGRARTLLGAAVSAGWFLGPLGLVALLPTLMLAVADRWFTHWQLALAMPDVMLFLVVTGVTGGVVFGVRLAAWTAIRTSRGRPSSSTES